MSGVMGVNHWVRRSVAQAERPSWTGRCVDRQQNIGIWRARAPPRTVLGMQTGEAVDRGCGLGTEGQRGAGRAGKWSQCESPGGLK